MTEISVSVPGKVMLAGEYSVLAGGRALAVALGRELTVSVKDLPEAGQSVIVDSNLWQEPRRLDSGDDPATYSGEPLMEAVARGMRLYGIAGARVEVRSDLDVNFGIGSSSALRLAVLLALEELARSRRGEAKNRPRTALWGAAREAFFLQRNAQQQASGYDIATQLVGGLAVFTPAAASSEDDLAWPGACTTEPVERLKALDQVLQIYVGGRGAPTGSVTRATLGWLQQRGLMDRVAAATDDLIADFGAALADPENPRQVTALVRAVGAHRRIFQGSPHFPSALAKALEALPGSDATWSFKTTGAGGEDALLLIGTPKARGPAAAELEAAGWRPLAAPFAATGARIARQGARHG